MKQSFGTGTRALSSALALSLAVNVWPVTPVVVMAEEPAGPTVLQGILQGPEDESEPVSYTHLDVYKRQVVHRFIQNALEVINGGAVPCAQAPPFV